MKTRAWLTFCILLLAAEAVQADDAPTIVTAGPTDVASDQMLDEQAPAAEPAEASPTTAPDQADGEARRDPFPNIHLDKARRRIYVNCTSLQPGQPLELIACSPHGREHESVVVALARPSHIHLTLLAAGFASGHPIGYDEKAEKVIPPTGDRVDMLIQWKDKQGREHTEPIEKWMRNIDPAGIVPDLEWIFTGSVQLDDGRYLADLEGSVVSIANFPDATLDLPGLHSRDQALLEFEANAKTMPPVNTRCTLILLPPADLRITLDRFGKVALEGRVVAPDRLKGRLVSHHASRDDAFVVVTVSPDAIAADGERLFTTIQEAGFAADRIRRQAPATQPDDATGAAFPTNDPRAAIDLLTGQWHEQRETVRTAVDAQRDWFGYVQNRTQLFGRQYAELADYIRRAQDQYREAIADRRDHD